MGLVLENLHIRISLCLTWNKHAGILIFRSGYTERTQHLLRREGLSDSGKQERRASGRDLAEPHKLGSSGSTPQPATPVSPSLQAPLGSQGESFNHYFSKFTVGDGCWLWTGAINRDGYGQVFDRAIRKNRGAHRLVYELLRGQIPEGLELDHLCRVRSCVNPDHLQPVSHQVNTLRGETLVAAYAGRTHCKNGHAYTKENLCNTSAGYRRCLTCARSRNREAYRKRVKA